MDDENDAQSADQKVAMVNYVLEQLDEIAKRAVTLKILFVSITANGQGTMNLTGGQIGDLIVEANARIDSLQNELGARLVGQIEATGATRN